jgi:hypothetical protein
MAGTFSERLSAIEWAKFGTAYGPAVTVPDQLRRLAGSDQKAALDACHELCSGLCHQHISVGSAAFPALPFLLEVLDSADSRLSVELLDILLGFAIGTNFRQVRRFLKWAGDRVTKEEIRWVSDLRAALVAELPRLRRLALAENEKIARFAQLIVKDLTTPAVAE